MGITSSGVFGLLVSPVAEDLDRLLALHRRGVPVVLVDRDGAGTPLAYVAVDDVAGGHMALGHLCEQRRTHITYVGGPLNLRQVADRLTGARAAAPRRLLDRVAAVDQQIGTIDHGSGARSEKDCSCGDLVRIGESAASTFVIPTTPNFDAQ